MFCLCFTLLQSLGYIVADDCDGDSVKSRSSNGSEHDLDCVPRTNAMDVEVPMICDSAQKVPGHVLFNIWRHQLWRKEAGLLMQV